MDDVSIKPELTAEERLRQNSEERKVLKEQVKSERTLKLEQDIQMRADRDEKIEEVRGKLKQIQSAIYNYNKLGKVAKMSCDVMAHIQALF